MSEATCCGLEEAICFERWQADGPDWSCIELVEGPIPPIPLPRLEFDLRRHGWVSLCFFFVGSCLNQMHDNG